MTATAIATATATATLTLSLAQGFVSEDASEQQLNVMASQLARNLAQKFSSANPEDR